MERRRLWRRWLAFVAAGEVVGFAAPAVVGILVRDASAGTQLVLLPVAGLVEGAVLGFAQAAVLRRTRVTVDPRAWVVATSLAAAVAWFLGMLPSTTHDSWSTWPVARVMATAVVLSAALLCSIGVAQALVLPRGSRGRWAWVGWTALGWCAGLIAFMAVAPPLWQPDQARWLLVVIGVAGGCAMTVAMAAVTGVGAVRLVDRARPGALDAGFAPGQHLVSSWLGRRVYDASGEFHGRVRDLVADLATDRDHPPVTQVLIGTPGGRRLVAPLAGLTALPEMDAMSVGGSPEPASDRIPGATALLIRRDVLDSPVVLATPPGRARVSDVVVEIGRDGTRVVGVDLSPSGMARRLVRRSPTNHALPSVPLSSVHLVSAHGHAAQLAAPDPTVLALPAQGMAEVLTRLPVPHARDIIDAADRQVREEAVLLLHPHVRGRVTGSDGPPRRARRLSGWRLHRPGAQPPGGDDG
jgi:hypothetical protein